MVPQVTFRAWVKAIMSVKVSDDSCMDGQGSKAIVKAASWATSVFNAHHTDRGMGEQCRPCRRGTPKKHKAISNWNQTQNKELPCFDTHELDAICFYNSHSQNLKPEETIKPQRLTSWISQSIKSHPVFLH